MKTLSLTFLLLLVVVSAPMANAYSPSIMPRDSFAGIAGGATVFDTNAFSSVDKGSFIFQGFLGSRGTVTGNFSLTYSNGIASPQMHISPMNPSEVGGLPLSFGSHDGDKLSMLNHFLCSSAGNDCAHKNLFRNGIDDPDADYLWHHKLMLAPEPTAGLLLGTGLLAAGTVLRRRIRPISSRTQREA